MAAVLLECGHAANALDRDGRPSCAICAGRHPGASTPTAPPSLAGRVARCGSSAKVPGSGHAEAPSSLDLAFFEFRGDGSRAATDYCRHCGYAQVAHGPDAPRWRGGGTAVERAGCPGFEPHGPFECDTYYCGCKGFE